MAKTKDCYLLESFIEEIQQQKNVKVNVSAIERTLERMFGSKFHINILPYNAIKQPEFFGMHVYPSDRVVDRIVSRMLQDESTAKDICELWKGCNAWDIEIDGMLLYDSKLNATPEEVVAILMHEIGHTVYSNELPRRLTTCIKMGLLKANYTIRKLCASRNIRKLFKIAVIGSCQTKDFNYINDKPEFEADKFAYNMGYGKALDSVLTKIIVVAGNDLINRGQKALDNETEILVAWSIENIASLEIRKTKLRQLLDAQTMKTPSIVLKRNIEDIRTSFFGCDEDDFKKQLLMEQSLIDTHRRIIKEAHTTVLENGIVPKIDPNESRFLHAECSRIDGYDTAMEMLTKLTTFKDICEVAMDESRTRVLRQPLKVYENFNIDIESMISEVEATLEQLTEF